MCSERAILRLETYNEGNWGSVLVIEGVCITTYINRSALNEVIELRDAWNTNENS